MKFSRRKQRSYEIEDEFFKKLKNKKHTAATTQLKKVCEFATWRGTDAEADMLSTSCVCKFIS